MKRKTGNRMLTTGLVLAMTAGMFAGCGNSAPAAATDNASADTETLAETSETAAVQETVKTDNGEVPTLIWWTVGGTPADDFDQAISEISDYAEEKIGVRIDVKIAGWADYDTKMNNIVNTGEYFDLMFVNNTNYSKFVNLNALENITDLVQSETPDLYGFIPQELWDGVKIHNNVYAVPTYKDSSMTQFWMLDDTYVQKYNIDVEGIKDFATLNDALQTIKEGEGKSVYPMKLAQGSTFNGFFNGYDDLAGGVSAIGVWYEDEERKVVSLLEQDDVKEKLNWLHKWYQDGIINPDANVLTEPQKKLPFSSAQGWPSAVATWQVLNGVEKYDAFKVFGPLYSTDTIQGSMNAVSINSKYKDECLKFLQLVNTDSKLRDMLAYGVPDKTFKYVGDGVIEKQTDTWPLAAYTQGTFFNMSITEDADPDQWDQVKKQNEEAVSSSCLGFSLDLTNIQNEMSNCLTVWQKYKYDLLTGASDPETAVPAVIQELKAAGFDTVIQEAQKQINEFYN